jgi:hypothetical protein
VGGLGGGVTGPGLTIPFPQLSVSSHGSHSSHDAVSTTDTAASSTESRMCIIRRRAPSLFLGGSLMLSVDRISQGRVERAGLHHGTRSVGRRRGQVDAYTPSRGGIAARLRRGGVAKIPAIALNASTRRAIGITRPLPALRRPSRPSGIIQPSRARFTAAELANAIARAYATLYARWVSARGHPSAQPADCRAGEVCLVRAGKHLPVHGRRDYVPSEHRVPSSLCAS